MATKVKLYSKELDEVKEHDLEHANRIFAYKHQHGWELRDNNFKLQDGLIVRSGTGTGTKTNKPGDTGHSSKA